MVKYTPRKRVTRRKAPYKKKRVNTNMRYTSKLAKPFPMGQSFSTKLQTSFTQAVSATPVADYVVHGNSLYANGLNAIQPIGFDELMGIYEKFRVTGCTIVAKYVNTSTTPTVATVIPSNSNTSITSLNSARAMAGSVSRISLSNAVQATPTYHKIYRSSARVLGNNKQTMKDEDFAGSASANPSDLWYIHLNAQALDETAAITGYWVVSLTYYATFFERKNLLLS